MRHAKLALQRALTGFAAVVLAACSGSPPPVQTAAVPQAFPYFAIDAQAAVTALSTKPNRLWQDQSTNGSRVREALKARYPGGYGLQAAGVTWTNALGSPCSSVPAYTKVDYQNTTGPNPAVGDFIYVVTDTGQVQRINPTTQAKTTANLGTAFSKSAVIVSGDNRRVYLTSSNGTFFILDAVTLATIWSAKISQVGFVGMAPFIDYSNGGGFPLGSDEHVYCMSTDGSLYDVNVKRSFVSGAVTQTVAAWTSSNGTDQGAGLAAWTTKVNAPFGVAVTPGSTPVMWAGRAYWGTNTGTFYRVAVNPASPLTVPVVTSWNLGQYTTNPGPNGMACDAPPALDYDNALNVTSIFAPCGDRVCYIDAASGKVYPSAALAADVVPPAAKYAGQLSTFPYTTATNSYTSFDWACVAANNLYTPTRWGNGGATSIFGTPVSCATIKKDPIGGNMWAGQFTSPGAVQGLTPAGNVVFTTNSSNNQVNEIAFDDSGNCFAGHNATPTIAKFNNAGTLVGTFTYPGGKSAGWPQPDHTGALWCTSMSTSFMAGGGNSVTKFNAAGVVQFTIALTDAFSIAVDSANNAYVSTSTAAGAKVYKYNSAGTLQAGWPINVGKFASYIAIEPGTNNIWTTNYNSNTVSKLSPLGVTLGTYATPAGPWAIAFDLNGQPWVSCIGATNVVKMSTGGAIQASYAIPGGGQPFELAFDGSGACWVSCSNGTYKIFDLGNLSDLFATDGFGATGDGDDSLAAMKFRITKGNFAGKPPVSASLTITAATTPSIGAVESLDLYSMDNYLNSTNTLWKGWQTVASINMDYNNRAATNNNGGNPVASLPLILPTKDSSQTFNLTTFLPTDALNTTDPTYAWQTYGFNSTGKALVNAAHWYSNTTAPGVPQQPTLNVKLSTTAAPTTNGIQCQPLVDTEFGRIYVLACNTVFELPYSPATPDDIRDSAKIFYNVTKAGRGGGPLSGGKFLYPLGNMQQNFYGDLFVVDQEVSTGKMYANRFNRKFFATPTTDHLAANFDATPATGTVGQAMIWDYDKGSVYFTSSNNMLVRGTLY